MKSTRQEVFEVINDERDYQEKIWKRPKHNHSAIEYLVYIDHYVKQAMELVSTKDDESDALPNLRKIAALAVAAMEEHGAIDR
jgi:hypothetical protein